LEVSSKEKSRPSGREGAEEKVRRDSG
jgi:hypothetical protein